MSTTFICKACGKPFTRCRFNSHHQIYCTRLGCVRRRKQTRQRASDNRRYREDKAFQEKKRRKSRDYMRKRRQKEKEAAKAAKEYDPADVLTGLVSHLTGEDNPEVVRESIKSYSSRGRRLSHCAAVTVRSP